MQCGILFIFSLFYEYSRLEYVHIHVIYRVHQAEYGIHILVAASQDYVNTYSTCRLPTSTLGNSACLLAGVECEARRNVSRRAQKIPF